MSVAALNYVRAVLVDGGLKTFLKHGKIDHLFRSESDKALFGFVDHHARTYGKLPDAQTVLTHAKIELPEAVPEPSDYYLDLLRRGYVEVSIRQASKQAEGFLTGDSKDPIAALDKLRAGISEIDARQMAPFVTDYREAAGLLWTAYVDAVKGGDQLGLKFGWPTLDAMAGGLQEGDVISWAGRSGLGKTWMMLWSALSIWKQGKPVLFISMEIKPAPILQRLSAIDAKVGASALKTGALTTAAKTDYKTLLNALPHHPHPFWVVDGNLKATANDIQALVLQLKPAAVFIDGAYLMKHPTEKDRYRRVAENMDLIKQDIAATAPVVASWQFSREAKKLKKGELPGLEHIGYSDAIGTHSSLVLGLFEDDSVETEVRRRVNVLKGRSGEAGQFYINWRFDGTTEFSEVAQETLEELQF
jgi:replicative DNA helicase